MMTQEKLETSTKAEIKKESHLTNESNITLKRELKAKISQIKFTLNELCIPILDAEYYFIFPVPWVRIWTNYLTG